MAIWDKYERSYTVETLKMIVDETGEESTAEIVPDNFSNSSYLFFKSELCSCLWEAFDKLGYDE